MRGAGGRGRDRGAVPAPAQGGAAGRGHRVCDGGVVPVARRARSGAHPGAGGDGHAGAVRAGAPATAGPLLQPAVPGQSVASGTAGRALRDVRRRSGRGGGRRQGRHSGVRGVRRRCGELRRRPQHRQRHPGRHPGLGHHGRDLRADRRGDRRCLTHLPDHRPEQPPAVDHDRSGPRVAGRQLAVRQPASASRAAVDAVRGGRPVDLPHHRAVLDLVAIRRPQRPRRRVRRWPDGRSGPDGPLPGRWTPRAGRGRAGRCRQGARRRPPGGHRRRPWRRWRSVGRCSRAQSSICTCP